MINQNPKHCFMKSLHMALHEPVLIGTEIKKRFLTNYMAPQRMDTAYLFKMLKYEAMLNVLGYYR